MKLESIQSELQRAGLDGWLFFDHHLRDPLAYRVLELEDDRPRHPALVLLHSRAGRAARAGASG